MVVLLFLSVLAIWDWGAKSLLSGAANEIVLDLLFGLNKEEFTEIGSEGLSFSVVL